MWQIKSKKKLRTEASLIICRKFQILLRQILNSYIILYYLFSFRMFIIKCYCDLYMIETVHLTIPFIIMKLEKLFV